MTPEAAPPTRVALIGYGLAGKVFHASLIAAVPELELAAIVTRDDGRRAQAAADFPAADLVGDAAEIWERGDIGLVVVATVNRAHAPLARAAIDAGIPVVVDKPLTATAAEGRTLAAHAAQAGVPLIVFQNRRWDGDFLTLRSLIDEGLLGRVLRFESRFERWRPQPSGGWRELGAPEDGGGLLLDLGSHLVDQALQLFGSARAVYAELDPSREGAQADDDTFVALEHASGVRSHLWMSAIAAQLGPRLRVLGDRAGYVVSGLDPQEDQLASGLRPGDPGFGEVPEERWGRLGTDDAGAPAPTEAGCYGAFYASVAATIRDGAPSPVDIDGVLAALDVLEAARVSAAERRVVTMG